MVLTKSAFFHTDWLKAYWSSDEKLLALRDYVTERKSSVPALTGRFSRAAADRNCEDILMSHLVARHTRVAPIHVKVDFEDDGLPSSDEHGISSIPHHGKARTECVRHFSEVLGEDTLVSTSIAIGTLKTVGAVV